MLKLVRYGYAKIALWHHWKVCKRKLFPGDNFCSDKTLKILTIATLDSNGEKVEKNRLILNPKQKLNGSINVGKFVFVGN